jgi:hypothetical protein
MAFQAEITLVEGPPENPPDATKVIASIGYCTLGTAGQVFALNSSRLVPEALGYGGLAECLTQRTRVCKNRQLAAPMNATTIGVLSSMTQTGTGPLVAFTAPTSPAPYDDASVIAKITKAGALGVAMVALSYSYLVVNDVPQALYQDAVTIPEKAKASVIGTVDVDGIVYALPATVTGTVDLTGLTYGPGGTLDGLTLLVDIDNAGIETATFGTGALAPTSPADVVTQLNADFTEPIASLNLQNQLVLKSTVIGAAGEIDVSGGTGRVTLGFSVAVTLGTAGALDGLTLILEADTGGPHTATFTPPLADSAALVAQLGALAGVDADVYTAMSRLRVQSATAGAASTLSITGGTGRTALGLALESATGADSTIEIPHLGVVLTFPTGTYVLDTTYAVTTTGPVASLAEVESRIDDIIAVYPSLPCAEIHIAFERDIITTLAFAAALDTKLAELEAERKFVFVTIGCPVDETDAQVMATLEAFRSRRVSICARGQYTKGGVIRGALKRSQSWAAMLVDGSKRFSADRGDHSAAVGVVPEVEALTADEQNATTPLVNPSGLSLNVMGKVDGGFYFEGGYTCAEPTSKYVDLGTTRTMLRAATVAQQAFNLQINRTDLDTDTTGKLTAGAANLVANAVDAALRNDLVPTHSQGVRVAVSRDNIFYTDKTINGTVTVFNRVPARNIVATLGPGLSVE